MPELARDRVAENSLTSEARITRRDVRASRKPVRGAAVTFARMADLHSSQPLHDRHVALGAKLAEFGGWEMPSSTLRRGHGAHRRA